MGKFGTLIFEDSHYERTVIAEHLAIDDVSKIALEYVKKLNPEYIVYYIRQWEEEGMQVYDVGSHSERFLFIPEE